MERANLIALACAVVALASAGLGALASLHWVDWDTTALVRMHDTLPISKLALRGDPAFRLRTSSGFYDGAFFYAIARDPLATGEAHRLMEQAPFYSHDIVVDEAPYYWGHPAYGWLAWLASGGGRPRAIPCALLAVGLLAIFAAGAAASLLARAVGWSPWGGLVVALNPGLVFAVNHDTSEPLGAALLLLGLVAYMRGRRGSALGLFAALCFVKEPLALVPLAIAGWELWRTRRPPLVAAAVVPAALWWIYVRIHLGAFPSGAGQQRIVAPLSGWWRGLLDAASQSWNRGVDTAQLGEAAVPLIIAVGLAIVVAAVYALRMRTAVDPAFLVVAVLYACISSKGVQYPKDLIRELALVVTMVPFALATRTSPTDAASERRYPRAPLPSRQRSES
jgi:hypothetical protein